MKIVSLRVAVVGGGVIGASIAYHLARQGASVHLFDKDHEPARGVTGQAFGWIGVVSGNPENRLAYDLLQTAVRDYARLRAELPGAFRSARYGSLVWTHSTAATEALASSRRAAGASIELVEASAIRAIEPNLLHVPELAVFSPDDIAIDPVHLTRTLVKAACAWGAVARWGQTIAAIETSGSKVTGIRVAKQTFAADIVIAAAGQGTNLLSLRLGLDLGLEISPAVLLRYIAENRFITKILRGPGLEVRQTDDKSLVVATSYIDDSAENGPEALGHKKLDILKSNFKIPGDVALRAATVGARPIFSNGLPRVGFATELDGLYIAVGHPGVILAPLLGRLAAEEIINGCRPPLLTSVKASR